VQDENDHKQNWAHITLYQIGQKLGFRAVDLFVLASRPAPTRRWSRQYHALKTHSYLWIFRQPGRRSRQAPARLSSLAKTARTRE